MTTPTARQQQVLDIVAEHATTGRPCPSQREIGRRMGISQPAVRAHLAALQRKGMIDFDPATHRAIRVVIKR